MGNSYFLNLNYEWYQFNKVLRHLTGILQHVTSNLNVSYDHYRQHIAP